MQLTLVKNSLQVKSGHFLHNHPASARAFATYPSSRGVGSATVSARVDGILAFRAKRSCINDYLLEHDQNVLQVDVDNMVRAHSASTVGDGDNEASSRELVLFAAANKENVSSVAGTEAGETGVISLATAHMRRIFSRFSELLLVDCRHKTNQSVHLNHPGFYQTQSGAYQDFHYFVYRYSYNCLRSCRWTSSVNVPVVQHSLLEANRDWHMDKPICHFKWLHPTGIELLRVITIV